MNRTAVYVVLFAVGVAYSQGNSLRQELEPVSSALTYHTREYHIKLGGDQGQVVRT